MLIACLTLLLGVTSCSDDEFETDLSEEQKQYTKAELIRFLDVSQNPNLRTLKVGINSMTDLNLLKNRNLRQTT